MLGTRPTRRYALWLLALLVIAGAVHLLQFFFVGQDPDIPSSYAEYTPKAEEGIVEVSYIGSVFEPAIVRVKKGQTVRFTNSSNTPLRVLNALENPNCMPEALDSCRALVVYESWEWRFDDSGAFDIINAEGAGRMTVVVI